LSYKMCCFLILLGVTRDTDEAPTSRLLSLIKKRPKNVIVRDRFRSFIHLKKFINNRGTKCESSSKR